MRKIIFLQALAGILLAVSCTTVNTGQEVIHFISNPTDQISTISIPGYNDSIRIMQITDSHIDIPNEKEADFSVYGERMHTAYMNPRRHYSRNISKSTVEFFDDLLLKAKEENVELLLLTGDIVNFPSAVSVQHVYDRLRDTGIPWLYTSGNHDWHYEGMEGVPDSLRSVWEEKVLKPLYNGLNPLYYSEVIKGINFVNIDNSTGEISDEQEVFLRNQLVKPEPVILLSHIPYSLGRGINGIGIPGFTDLLLSNDDKIIAVITGHIHRTSFYITGNMCQYTSMAGFQGASFLFDIRPR